MLIKVDPKPKLVKNARKLFSIAKGMEASYDDGEKFVIKSFVESTVAYSINCYNKDFIGFTVDCYHFTQGNLSKDFPNVISIIFCLKDWIEKTSEFKRENLIFTTSSLMIENLILKEKELSEIILNTI